MNLSGKGFLNGVSGSGTYVTGKSSPESKRIGLFCHEVIIPDSAYITPFLNTFYDFWAAVGYQVVSLKCNPNEYEKLMRDYELAGALILVPSQEILRDSRELAEAGRRSFQSDMPIRNQQDFHSEQTI